MFNDGKGGIYDRCAKCGRLVKLNKFLFGDLHLCAGEDEKGPEVEFWEPGTKKVLFTLPIRRVLELGRDMLQMQHNIMLKQTSQRRSWPEITKDTCSAGSGLFRFKND